MYVGTAAGFSVLHPVFAQGFMDAIGSNNLFSSATQDCSNKFAVSEHMYGFPFTLPFPDLPNTNCMIVVGANPVVSKWSFLQVPNPSLHLKEMERRGCKLYFVDPRKTESPDDFLYASVKNAFIKLDFASGKQSLVLQGNHPNWFHGCQVITEVRTYRKPKDVLVVLPITEVRPNSACGHEPDDRSFIKEVPLTSPFTEEGMIHVRTLNGQSINRYVPVL